jgi:hypothetical protein
VKTGAPAGFATLAEAVARKLAEPAKWKIPPALSEAAERFGLSGRWSPSDQRRLLGRPAQLTAAKLRQAHKFVFDETFSRLVIETAAQSPQTYARIFPTARVPFDHTWIEWDGTETRWGTLISPWEDGSDNWEVLLFQNSDDLTILPGGVHLSLREPLAVNVDPAVPFASSLEEGFFGSDYLKRWKSQRSTIHAIATHFAHNIHAPPFGDLAAELLERAGRMKKYPEQGVIMLGSDDPLEQLLANCTMFRDGAVRELVCGLALVATHIGGGPMVETRDARTRTHFYAGKFRPSYEYKVVQLRRPMGVPSLIRRAFPKTQAKPTRWHEVIGAWHHRRHPTPECAIHPRACPRAQWQQLDDDEADGGDIQACTLCQRRRWFVPGHARGDPELGSVDKDYEVTAAGHQVAA